MSYQRQSGRSYLKNHSCCVLSHFPFTFMSLIMIFFRIFLNPEYCWDRLMGLDLMWALCFLSEAPVLPFFVPVFFFRTWGWNNAVSLNQMHWTPWGFFPPWFPALVPIACLLLSCLSSPPLWETEAKSGSIVLHFCFPCFMLLKNFCSFASGFVRSICFPLATWRLALFLSFCMLVLFVQIYPLS